MSDQDTGPSTPQRPIFPNSDGAAEETPRTPSGLGLLSTPPRRPPRSLKRPREADVDAPEARGSSPLRLFQTPPLRPPRRARFSTGFTGLADPSPESVASSNLRPEGIPERSRSPASSAEKPRPTNPVSEQLGRQERDQEESQSGEHVVELTKEPTVEQAEEKDEDRLVQPVEEENEEQAQERIGERVEDEAEDEAESADVRFQSHNCKVIRHQENESKDEAEQGTAHRADIASTQEKVRNANSSCLTLAPMDVSPRTGQKEPHLITLHDGSGEEPFQLSD
ncbi:hypothetical protein CMUS01_04195 [Colletotrichum musicola]|uniref:Uncharacterized protein n=1 Tax=Colletotrichum musicola TaxID=2175873 RepID=A0A8H6NNL1_9PEZI|nr:hypothetical protein CMUS01_04195 [Colletotrichum musicola]